ncbi:TBC1 domain family member 19-like [Tubulanus polymorphus]|uniref:TBC1 domain family member 19-like n=1 Tax=Tubulanus polymorphus TaxID=672921 RepID=UPI003DA5C3A0
MSVSNEEHLTLLISKIVQDIQKLPIYSQLQKAARFEVSKPSLKLNDLKQGVKTALSNAGWEKKLRNEVYKCVQKNATIPQPLIPVEHYKEPLVYMRKAQVNWEKRILKSLNSMCTELNIPLAKKRPEREQRDLLGRWTELGQELPVDLSKFRPVYAPKDFLEVLAGVKNPNCTFADAPSFQHFWGVVQVPLKIKNIHELRLQYSEMSINQCQAGVDDCSFIPQELFESERSKLAKKVIAHNHGPVAQEFAKKGCNTSHRAEIWSQILGVTVDEIDRLYYEQLKHYFLQHDLLVDALIFKDVKLTASNDDQYFVFEDYIYQVLLPFSRDTHVLEHFANLSATPAKSYIRGKLGINEFAVNYPPNGVIPFHGFSMYVAPLCFIYNDVVKLYYVFREMYTRYFCRLHCISSHPQGIVSLCLLFESLLQCYEPQLFAHLKSVGAQPLKMAFKWLIRAFSGYLSSDQVLLLWDRILAYGSMELLPVLAYAIFSFRKNNLIQVQSYAAAEAVLADLTTLNVIPIIQLCLFAK